MMTKTSRFAAALVALPLAMAALTQTACVSPLGPAAATAQTNILSRLYFGRSIRGSVPVSEQQWATFLAEVVTRHFPEGFTTWPAQGQWRDAAGTITREPTFVLEIVHTMDARSLAAIESVIADYKRRFQQVSVLWVRDRVETSF